MSALPPKADIRQRIEHVCLVPEADIAGYASSPMRPPPSKLIKTAGRMSCEGDNEARHLDRLRFCLFTSKRGSRPSWQSF